MSPESRTANPITRSALTPSRRAVLKSVAAARMCNPMVVRSSERGEQREGAAAVTTTARRS